MKFKIPKIGILFMCSLFLFSCAVQIKENLPLGNKLPKIPEHWVVLDIANATQEKNTYLWDFKTDIPIEFDVQILTHKPPARDSKAFIWRNGNKTSAQVGLYLLANHISFFLNGSFAECFFIVKTLKLEREHGFVLKMKL